MDGKRLEAETTEAQISEYVREHRETDACRRLLVSVLETAAADLAFLETVRGRRLRRHESKRARDVWASCPRAFFDGPWYQQVCDYLGLDAERFRRLVYDRARAA